MARILSVLFWAFFGGIAICGRMLVVSVGCLYIAQVVMDWPGWDWRFWSVYGLVVVAYVTASMIEIVSDVVIKNAAKETKGNG